MKLEDTIKNLFFALMLCIWGLIILFIVNSLCGKCIHKDLDKILNVQGYAYDIKHNIVEPYEKLENCETCEKPRFAKHPGRLLDRLPIEKFLKLTSVENNGSM